MKLEKLRDCPFAQIGVPHEPSMEVVFPGGGLRVECLSCGARGPVHYPTDGQLYSDFLHAAIAKWNRNAG